MEAIELAEMLGKSGADTQVIEMCEIYIASAIEYINNHYKNHNCKTSVDRANIASSYKLAIKQFAEIQETMNGYLKLVDTGDISMTYDNSKSEKKLDDPYYHLDMYLDKICGCFKKVRFIPIRRFKGGFSC